MGVNKKVEKDDRNITCNSEDSSGCWCSNLMILLGEGCSRHGEGCYPRIILSLCHLVSLLSRDAPGGHLVGESDMRDKLRCLEPEHNWVLITDVTTSHESAACGELRPGTGDQCTLGEQGGVTMRLCKSGTTHSKYWIEKVRTSGVI